MQGFRRFTEGTLGKVLMVVITLPFVVAGFYGYFASGAGADQVAKVGGTSISTTTLDNEVQAMRQQVRQSNPNVDPDLLARFVSPQMVLEGLINNALLEQAAGDAHMVVSQDQISKEIVAAPAFQDSQGKFSQDLFQQQISSRGYTPASFISTLQAQAVRNQLQAAYSMTDFSLPKELTQQQQLEGQTRDLSYVELSLATTAAAMQISDDQAKAYFTAHQDSYKRPPQIRIQWVELSPDSYQITVTPDQIAKEYSARKQVLETAAAQNQERQIGDIFIAIDKQRSADQAKAEAEKLAASIKQGGDFAALAKTNSDDPVSAPKGGDLGWLMQDALPADMGKAAFALKQGEVTDPIKTSSGYHLLKVEAIRQQALPSLDSMKSDIEASIRKQEVLEKISSDSSQLSDLAYEHSDLTVPAEKLGLQIRTSDWFSVDQPTGFAANPKVLEALKDPSVMSQGQNSQLLDLGNNHYAVIHVSDHRDAAQLAYADVQDKVKQQLKLDQAQQQLGKLAQNAAQAKDMQSVAALWQAKVTTLDALKRQDTRLQPDVLADVFSLPPTASTSPQVWRDQQGNLWALAITKVTPGTVDASQQQANLVQQGAQRGQESFRAYVSWLRSTAEIKINQDKLTATTH